MVFKVVIFTKFLILNRRALALFGLTAISFSNSDFGQF